MMTVNKQTPGPGDHQESAEPTSAEIVSGLREILGARLVAYIGHVSSTRQVGEWANGIREPSAETLARLRAAYFIASLLREREVASTVQSWFQGMNPELNDRAPARLLRDQPIKVVGPEVMAAAHSFAYVG
jgi:hypothetical protein